MTVQQRPVHRPGSPESAYDESQYAAFAAAQFRILKDYMALAKLNTFSRVVTLANGVVITCQKCFNREDIFISVPVLPFTEEITKVEMGLFIFNNKNYPKMSLLYDLNNTEDSEFTKNRKWDAGDMWASSLGKESLADYGNVDWKGFDDVVLCWKGVSSRHFEVDPYIAVPGYMIFDEYVTLYDNGIPLEVPVFTPFGPNIYAGGRVATTVTAVGATTTKVLGCAYVTFDGTRCLVAVVGMNYRDMQNPSSTEEAPAVGGFFTEVWVLDKAWKRIGYEQGSRHTANWFFNQSGNEAQCVQNGTVFMWSIAAQRNADGTNSFSASSSSKPACSGQRITTYTSTTASTGQDKSRPLVWTYDDPSNWGIQDGDTVSTSTESVIGVNETRTCIEAVDYRGDAEVQQTSVYNFSEVSEYGNTASVTYGWLREYPYDPPAGFDVYLSADRAFIVGDSPATVVGGCAPYTYSGSGPFTLVPGSGQIASISCLAGSLAGGYITVTDANGETESVSFRLNVPGTWVRVSQTLPCYEPYYSSCTDTQVPTACDVFGWNYDLTTGGTTRIGYGFCKYPVCPDQAPHSCGGYLASIGVYEFRCS